MFWCEDRPEGTSEGHGVTTPQTRFERLYAEQAGNILAFCRRRVSPDMSDDVVADVFMVAWRRIDEVPDDHGAMRWLYSVALGVIRNQRRSAMRVDRLRAKLANEPRSSVESPEPLVVRREQDRIVATAALALPEKYRQVLLLAEWEGLSRSEIGEILGISRTAVDKRASRAYARLRRRLGAGHLTNRVAAPEGGSP